MKKIAVTLCLFGMSIFFLNAKAQTHVGIKGGVNLAHLTGFEGSDRVGAHIGLFFHNTIDRNWCFQPEILYSGEGQRYFSEGEERVLALDYIQIPLMLQYYPARQLYFEAGPQIGLLASARDKSVNGTDKVNAIDDFNRAQLGLNLGIGVNVTRNVGFYGRYNFGLTDVSKFDDIVDQSMVGQLGITVRLR